MTGRSPGQGTASERTTLGLHRADTKSIMLAEQLRALRAYGRQRTAELGIEPADVPAHIREFLKGKNGA